MGVALMTNERWEGALVWLRRAYNLAGPGPRREELHRYLTELETRTPMSTVEGLTPPV